MPEADSAPRTDFGPAVKAGLFGLFLLVGVFGSWAALTRISGAVIAHGVAQVSGRPVPVEAVSGGVLASVEVEEGDIVAPGQVLARIDPTLIRSRLDIAMEQLALALAREARLTAEEQRSPLDAVARRALPFDAPDTTQADAVAARLYAARQDSILRGRAMLDETLAQMRSEKRGTLDQIAALRERLGYIDTDIAAQTSLSERGLTRLSQLNALRGTRAELAGTLASLDATRARIDTRMREARLATEAEEEALREQAVADLAAVRSRIEELIPEIVSLRADLDRMVLRAPVGGTVHDLRAQTSGIVLAAGDPVLEIVSTDRGVDFEVRIDPMRIDQVKAGQTARIVVSGADPALMPEMVGQVARVPVDTVTDAATQTHYYRVELAVSEDELRRAARPLLPGTPIEVYLETEMRSIVSYLVSPLSRHLRKTFRET